MANVCTRAMLTSFACTAILSACGGGDDASPSSAASIDGDGSGTPSPSPSTTAATLPAGTNTTFADRTNTMVAQFAGGAASGDIDNDGDIDVLLLTAEPTNSAYYWENQLAGANTVNVRMRGKAPNTYAVGAIIELTINDTTQTRMVAVNSNFASHNSTDQIFGLGAHTSAGL
ncbi:MAG: ASPIC/UnbV domain-containing protein [Pseudomonadota bacterium]